MPSLTQAEAVDRARLLSVESYDVDLDLARGPDVFGSVTVVRFRCVEPGAGTFIELAGTDESGSPVAVTLNGRPVDAEVSGDRLHLADLAAENELVVRADLPYSRSGEGLHRLVDPADGAAYLYAQSSPADAQRIFACFDQPDLKARLRLTVTAPEDWTVIGNGAATRTAPGRWEFTEVGPMSCYVFSICAGPYHSVYTEHDGIRLGWHCRASLADVLEADADELFTITGQCFDWYHRTFQMRYPFGDKYDQVFVPELLFGAMENIGCVTFRDELLFRSAVTDAQRELRAMVIAHEMAHMWFGDLVTLRWWDDMWLNESFAEYLGFRVASEATRFQHAWATFNVMRKITGYQADQGPSTHPVAPTDVPDVAHGMLNVDAISYPKGASALRQLATWLGDETFFAGLRTYFQRYAYRNATLADLIGTMAEASGQDLTGWAELWLRRAQVNTLVPVASTGPDGRYEAVSVEQHAPEGYPYLRPHRIRIGHYTADGGKLRRELVEIACDPTVDSGLTPVGELTGRPAADLLLLNDGDLTFARVRFTPGTVERLPELLPALADPVSRSVVWSATWDMVRSGELAPESFVAQLVGALPAERELPLLEEMLGLTRRFVTRRYLPADRRAVVLPQLTGLCRRILAEAGDNAGRRLAAVRGTVAFASTGEEVELLRAWLRGDRLPDGVAMDAELRWSVLERLVVLGAAGVDEIEAQLAGDQTAAGAVQATRCRAALPDADAKRAAWALLMTDRDLSNRHLEAVGAGFWHPEHAELTEEYVPRFFAELPAAAEWRSPAMLTITVAAGYPLTTVRPDTVERAERLLALPGLHPVLRRWVTDQNHEVRVALAARAAPVPQHG
ncbi:MAG: aminopeptidase N [Actinocatenispora sp.]